MVRQINVRQTRPREAGRSWKRDRSAGILNSETQRRGEKAEKYTDMSVFVAHAVEKERRNGEKNIEAVDL